MPSLASRIPSAVLTYPWKFLGINDADKLDAECEVVFDAFLHLFLAAIAEEDFDAEIR